MRSLGLQDGGSVAVEEEEEDSRSWWDLVFGQEV